MPVRRHTPAARWRGGLFRKGRRAGSGAALRAEAWTLSEIATELGVSKSSVSLWTRDVEFTPRPRNRGHRSHRPHPLTLAKAAELEAAQHDAVRRIGTMSDRDLFMYGLALYAGEGSKGDGELWFTNSSEDMVRLYLRWLRRFFDVDESRMRVKLYLHEGLDVEAAIAHWSIVTGVPAAQFRTPYRAVADPTRRRTKHVHGCVGVGYHSTRLHRRVMALIEAVASGAADPG